MAVGGVFPSHHPSLCPIMATVTLHGGAQRDHSWWVSARQRDAEEERGFLAGRGALLGVVGGGVGAGPRGSQRADGKSLRCLDPRVPSTGVRGTG